MKNTLKRQIKEMIEKNETIVNVINYLFTCDYEATEIIKMLVKHFDCKEQLLKDVFAVDFGIEFSPFINEEV